MATGILGLGSSGSTGLSQELIDKLKAAEAKGRVDPYTTKLETWDKELTKITEIETKVKELLTSISNFDLYKSSANAFEQVTATTSGTSASFNALDVSILSPGVHNVEISQLAQRDVYQSITFSDKAAQIPNGSDSTDKISITISGETYSFTTAGQTYSQMAEKISLNPKFQASVEQVSDSSYRLVIKSTDSGEANKLSISTTGLALGFDKSSSAINDFGATMASGTIKINDSTEISTDGKTYAELMQLINLSEGGNKYTATQVGNKIEIYANDGSNVNIVETGANGLNFQNNGGVIAAQNMQATVDGVQYNLSSNSINIQGNLTMTALELGKSSISIQQDNTNVSTGLEAFVSKYNELVDLIDAEQFSEDTPISNIGSLKTIMGDIKKALFGTYGTNNTENIFSYGFALDTLGHMTLDSTVLSSAISDNIEGLKSLFVGVAEKPGIGTVLKEYLDGLDGYSGALTQYGEAMVTNKTKLEAEKTKAQEMLDTKYSLMSSQFAAYTAIITQMEASFAGMKSMIEQSSSGN